MQVRGKKIVSLRRLLPYVAGVLWLFFIIPDATAVGTEVQPPERLRDVVADDGERHGNLPLSRREPYPRTPS